MLAVDQCTDAYCLRKPFSCKPCPGIVPVEFKTRTHNRRVGSARRRADGGARRRWAEQRDDILDALEANRPSGPPAHCKQLFRTSLRKHEQKKILCKPWREQNVRLTRGLSPVYHQDRERSSLLAVDQSTDAYLSLLNSFHARHVRELSKASKTRRFNVSREARTSEILCKPTEKPNQWLTSGLSAVYQRGEKRSLFLAADLWEKAFSSV